VDDKYAKDPQKITMTMTVEMLRGSHEAVTFKLCMTGAQGLTYAWMDVKDSDRIAVYEFSNGLFEKLHALLAQ
jgi:hypothetical protein